MRGITYKEWLIEDLKNLQRNRFAIEQLKSELRTLEKRFTAIKATDYDKIPGGGGGNAQEEKMLTAIAKKDELEADLKATALHVEDIERLLETLPEDELTVIERMFILRERGAAQKLMEELGYEKSQIYNIRDRALKNLAYSRWGRGYRP